MRLGLRSCTPLPRVVSRGGRLVKATQLGLFGGEVKLPGSRGGKYYVNEKGVVRYGRKPTGRTFNTRFEAEEHASGLQRAADAKADAALSGGRPTTRVNGDLAAYTGKTETIHGAQFFEVELLEGHPKGAKKVTREAPRDGMPEGTSRRPRQSRVPSYWTAAANRARQAARLKKRKADAERATQGRPRDPFEEHYESFVANSSPEEEHMQANDRGFTLDEWEALPKAERGKHVIRAEAEEATRAALGPHAQQGAWKLNPPELGQTRSGKAVPHPEDPGALHPERIATLERYERMRASLGQPNGLFPYQVTGQRGATVEDAHAWLEEQSQRIRRSGSYSAEHGAHFRTWTREDHADAGKVHDTYARHHRARSKAGGGRLHDDLARSHEQARDHHNALASMPESYFRR